MRRRGLIFLLFTTLAYTQASAECCTCASSYQQLESKIDSLSSEVKGTMGIQKKETDQLRRLSIREGMSLSYEKARSDLLTQTKDVDSVGFAYIIEQFKAERVNTKNELTIFMNDGFDMSGKDATAILDGMRGVK